MNPNITQWRVYLQIELSHMVGVITYCNETQNDVYLNIKIVHEVAQYF